MDKVQRVYVEKKPAYAVRAGELKNEIKEYLNIRPVTGVRVLVRYDIENFTWEPSKRHLAPYFPSRR